MHIKDLDITTKEKAFLSKSVKQDNQRPILQSVFYDETEHHLVASNGQMLSVLPLSEGVKPSVGKLQVGKFPVEPNYVDYKVVIPSIEYNIKVNHKDLYRAMQQIMAFSEVTSTSNKLHVYPVACFDIRHGAMDISYYNKEVGDINVTMEATIQAGYYLPDNFSATFHLNLGYLFIPMKLYGSKANVFIGLHRDDNRPVTIKSSDSMAFSVIMPFDA